MSYTHPRYFLFQPWLIPDLWGIFWITPLHRKYKFPLNNSITPLELTPSMEVPSGRKLSVSALPSSHFRPAAYTEQLSILITNTPKHPIILGTPWLQLHDPLISWSNKILDSQVVRTLPPSLFEETSTNHLIPSQRLNISTLSGRTRGYGGICRESATTGIHRGVNLIAIAITLTPSRRYLIFLCKKEGWRFTAVHWLPKIKSQ